jgi:hypothetical protein
LDVRNRSSTAFGLVISIVQSDLVACCADHALLSLAPSAPGSKVRL